MERFLYSFVWFLIIAGVGFVGWFGYSRLSHDFAYEAAQQQSEDPLLVYDDNSVDVVTVDDSDAQVDYVVDTTNDDNTGDTSNAGDIDGEYADLAAALQSLIDDWGGLMKRGSNGTRVGTVQKFLNVYNGNDINSGVDNDYGPGTESKVKAFQSAEGIDADGQAGSGTFQAMIDWLAQQ